MVAGPHTLGLDEAVAAFRWQAPADGNASLGSEETDFAYAHVNALIEQVVNAFAFVAVGGPRQALHGHGGIVCRKGKARMMEFVGIAHSPGIKKSGRFEHLGARPFYGDAMTVVEVARTLRPVEVRRLVEVTAEHDHRSVVYLVECILDETANGIFATGEGVAAKYLCAVGERRHGAERVAIVTANLVVCVVEIVEMTRIYAQLAVTEPGGELVDGAVVIVQRYDDDGVSERIAAEHAAVVAAEAVILQPAFLKAADEPGSEIRAVVIAYFAEGDKVGLELCYAVNNGFIASGHNGALLPDVPLQYGEAAILAGKTV